MYTTFYEHLGVPTEASAARIRDAYAVCAAKLTSRRRELRQHGGDCAAVDSQRSALDEAWEVLSDPMRRRRYDAMLQFTGAPNEASLWEHSKDFLVHPAAAIAVKLVRLSTSLHEVGEVELAASGAAADPPTLIPHDDDRTQPAIRRMAPEAYAEPAKPPPPKLTMPKPAPAAQPAAIHAVASTQQSVASLIGAHGYGGNLLRAVRESKGWSLDDIAEKTRISLRYLEALELESFDVLPSAPFVRGYVREMCRVLGLDPDETISGYMNRYNGE